MHLYSSLVNIPIITAVNMGISSKEQAKRILSVFGIGVLIFLVIINTSFYIPCLWKVIFEIQCPGCGLTRAFEYASRLDFINAVRMNILFLPLIVGMAAYFICAILDVFLNLDSVKRIDKIMTTKWMIAFAVILMILSWYYNIIRGI